MNVNSIRRIDFCSQHMVVTQFSWNLTNELVYQSTLFSKNLTDMGIPWRPSSKTLCFHCQGLGLDPASGNKDPTSHAAWPKEQKTYLTWFIVKSFPNLVPTILIKLKLCSASAPAVAASPSSDMSANTPRVNKRRGHDEFWVFTTFLFFNFFGCMACGLTSWARDQTNTLWIGSTES